MTSSHNAVIRTEYGPDDVPYPVFSCPVVFMARVLRYANRRGRFRQVADLITTEAAEVADLVARLSEPVAYADFAVHDGAQVLALRMTYVERAQGMTLCIDFRHRPEIHHRCGEGAEPALPVSGIRG